MARWLRRLGCAGGVIVLLLGAAVWWLFYDNRMPRSGRFDLDLAAIRAEAARLPGPGPARIEVELLSHTNAPRIGIVAGTSWGKMDMVRASYRLVWPDQSIIVDTGNSGALARRFGARSYDAAAWSRLVAAMDRASDIVVTHEHADHIGGLVESPHLAAIIGRARVTREQLADPTEMEPLRWPRGQTPTPLIYDRLHALAPGVVLMKAPGHTPGSQMVYVRRADGREYLFMGDVASNADNVRLQRIRPRYTTTYLDGHHDDRRAVMLETQALGRLATSDPALVLVPGHDAIAIHELVRRGLLHCGFRL
ncbi:MBL fold metallo-hydrolase [Sphingomonas sp.]|uniref:MBL fold metallo-hydrolase n=1 Tax=Sphingomonas sp. TaxID=28214 RepID=UPI003CC6277F